MGRLLGNPDTFCPGAPSLCKKQMGNKQQVGNELPGAELRDVDAAGGEPRGPGGRSSPAGMSGGTGFPPVLPGDRRGGCLQGSASCCHRSRLSLKASRAADRSL